MQGSSRPWGLFRAEEDSRRPLDPRYEQNPGTLICGVSPPRCITPDVPRHLPRVDVSNPSPPPASSSLANLRIASSSTRKSQHPNATGRRQTHAATWQCSLCNKRFTRAYNLRSHVRTHTNERPFMCALCGKTFARQHDRKRHEKLHYGEKSFVCRADDAADGQWGCGRAFARGDALARHLRSDAGSACSKPLFSQESERHHLLSEQRVEDVSPLGPKAAALSPVEVDTGILDLNVATGSGTPPSALLAQYLTLADIECLSPGTGNGIGSIRNIPCSFYGSDYCGDYAFEPISGAYATWWGAYMSTHHALREQLGPFDRPAQETNMHPQNLRSGAATPQYALGYMR